MLIIHTKCWGHVAHCFHHVPPWPTKWTPWVSVELEMSKHFSSKNTGLKARPTFQKSIVGDSLKDPSTWSITQLINITELKRTRYDESYPCSEPVVTSSPKQNKTEVTSVPWAWSDLYETDFTRVFFLDEHTYPSSHWQQIPVTVGLLAE